MLIEILDKIVAAKKQDLGEKKQILPVSVLKERLTGQKTPLDFVSALRGDRIKLIAEVKKASPSKGILCPDFDPVALARIYTLGGASAISVLTEVKHFQGRLEYLAKIKEEVNIPLLRKDFIFDEYQIYESAAYGADALLLIASILSREQLGELLELSRSLNLSCLVEVHNENEINKALSGGAEIIGINNRDLNTFSVDINTTRRLRPIIPAGIIVVSESGIHSRDDIIQLKEWGVNAALVGEALVTAADIPSKMGELLI
ncbi:indole-3-glycerol phosphate synthase TrpC [Chloroflexota bacterium]